MALKIVFMGTPDFAVPVLDAVAAAGHRIVAAYSQPPRPAGRGMTQVKSPVHLRAEALDIPVIAPLNFKADAERIAFIAHGADAAVVVAYGLILPEAVLQAPRLGCYNVHASKLPRWRGAAPIQRAIMAGDATTAVAIMRMEKGLDSGPVCLSQEFAISPDMTAGSLHDALSRTGAVLMVEVLERLEAGALQAVPQSADGVTYAAKIDKSETRIDFARSAADVVNHVRGLAPHPGAWFEAAASDGKPERIKVLVADVVDAQGAPGVVLDDAMTIACASGAVRLALVQRAGKKPVTAAELLRGFRLPPGTRVVTCSN